MVKTLYGEVGYNRWFLDSYNTEPWVTEWLLARFGKLTSGDFVVWEPACGRGRMADVLFDHGYNVLATDIHDYGYERMIGLVDFLGVESVSDKVKVIITNPPYDIQGEPGYPDVNAEMFIRQALKLMYPVGGKVFMLLRNEFDSAASRKDLFGENPAFLGKFVLTRRPRWLEKDQEHKASPRHNYSWFAWDWAKQKGEKPIIAYLYPPEKDA